MLPQPEQLDRAERLEPGTVGGVLETLSAMFDYVVVDAPHGFSDTALEIFDRSSTILLVTELSIPSARAARRALEVFQRLNYLVTPDRVRPIVNRFVENGAVSLAQFEETLGLSIAARIANDYAAVSKAINLGRPLFMDAAESRATRDLIAAIHETGMLLSVDHREDGTAVHARVSERLAAELAPFADRG